MKSVHKTLKLRHHKHTGKLLAHKHTSYRVLFLLMLVPVIAMAFVDQVVGASDLMVTAKVPVQIPAEAPVITNPKDGGTSTSGDVVVSGTCPVTNPAVIIAIYDNGVLIGSAQCSANGTFSVPVSLSYGSHTLIATVITVINDIGASSRPVTITYVKTAPIKPDGLATTSGGSSFGPPVRIVASDIYVTIDPDGHAVWHGGFADGTAPYKVKIDWGDGTVDTYTDAKQSNYEYAHNYRSINTYKIIIEVTDSNGDSTTLYSVGISLALRNLSATGIGAGSGDSTNQSMNPFVAFAQKYVWQIYISTLSGLSFLWYLEHGRHIVARSKKIGKLHHR